MKGSSEFDADVALGVEAAFTGKFGLITTHTEPSDSTVIGSSKVLVELAR